MTNMSDRNIKIQEVVRNTSAGRFSYSMYKGKIARRKYRRGRPHYDPITELNLTDADKVVQKEIPVESQLAKFLLGVVSKTAARAAVREEGLKVLASKKENN